MRVVLVPRSVEIKPSVLKICKNLKKPPLSLSYQEEISGVVVVANFGLIPPAPDPIFIIGGECLTFFCRCVNAALTSNFALPVYRWLVVRLPVYRCCFFFFFVTG